MLFWMALKDIGTNNFGRAATNEVCTHRRDDKRRNGLKSKYKKEKLNTRNRDQMGTESYVLRLRSAIVV